MLSYWEKQSLLQYDHIIIGGGIVGLSAAVSIKEKHPHAGVLVMERAILPAGASTKNAGFACIGSLTEILDDLEAHPPEEVAALVSLRRKGLQRLRARLGDDQIGYRENGSYELIGESGLPQLGRMDEVNRLLLPVLGGNAFSPVNEKIGAFGFSAGYTKALVQNHYEGELHTGRMMRRLTALALMKGVEVKTGAEVKKYEEEKDRVNVVAEHPHMKEEIAFSAKNVVICANAFTKAILPELDLQPGRGQVLITDPVPGLPFKGVFHFDRGYYYFREIDGRVLFGGGRNLDFAGEASTDFAYNPAILRDLEEKLQTLILPGIPFRVAQRWTGIMAFGKTRRPLVKKYSDRVFIGVRMGGMGIAIGSEVGEQLAVMATED